MKRSLFFTLFALAVSLLLAACGAQSASPASPSPATAPASGSVAKAACATDNHAPFDEFRSDPAAKLTASPKPKLIEFWAVW